MALQAEQLRGVLTFGGLAEAFALLGAELLAVMDLRPVLAALDKTDLSPDRLVLALHKAISDQASTWAEALTRALRDTVGPVTAAVLDAVERDYGVNALDSVTDVARVVALALRGVARQTEASTPNVGARIALGAGALLEQASATRAEVTAYVRARLGHQAKIVGAAYLGRARSAAMVAAMSAAGIEKLRFLATIDGHTTDICIFMHNRVMAVPSALSVLETAATAPDAEALAAMPWVHTRGGELVMGRPAGEVIIATIAERRKGHPIFGDGMSTADLEHEGLVLPPLHPYCRSIVVPEV